MKKLCACAVVLLSLFAAGCGSSTGPGQDTDDAASPVGQWELDNGTVDGHAFPLVDGYRVTMTLGADGTIGGTAACNSYGGSYELDGSALKLSNVANTEMGCEPAVMASEATFLDVLFRNGRVERVGEGLALSGDGFDLEFSAIAPVPTADLVGTTWVLDTIIDGDTASSVQGEPTLLLDETGAFTGSTGCRDLVGRYVIDGDALILPQMAANGECPPEFQAQDSAVISVLENAQIDVSGNRLTLTGSGNEGLVYRAAP